MTERPSSRSLCTVLVVALLGVVTGCLGAGPAAPATETPTPTPTTTATPNTDCPPALIVEGVEAHTESAVAYETLTADQQATFDRARNGSVEDFDSAWHDTDVVEHDGRYDSVGVIGC